MTATNQTRPWERPFWKPTPGKGGIFFYLISIHVLAIAGVILFPLPSLPVLIATLILTALGGFGTSVCYHRMLAHRTVKLNKVIEHFLIFWAMFNGSGSPASWVAYHRRHHARADTPDDISSPTQGGFWWAHMRWLYQSAPADGKWCRDLNKVGMNHICFAVDDIEADVARLRTCGFRTRNEIMDFHARKLVFVEGPEGVTIELSQWHAA